jgi:Glycosyl hydrolases family 15
VNLSTTGGSHVMEAWTAGPWTSGKARECLQFLTNQGTFQFPSLATGLFSASASQAADFALTGYRNVWLRDTVHIAHGHWRWGETAVAVRAVKSLLEFYHLHAHRFDAWISGTADPNDVMQRPHIRFNGDLLAENSQKWSHAQNDALGGFLWLASQMAAVGDLQLSPNDWQVLQRVVGFLEAVRYWQDADSGHWEETRKVEASSIGVATAGLTAFQQLQFASHAMAPGDWQSYATPAKVSTLIEQGRLALAEILPSETAAEHGPLARQYDSALLFLIYPFGVCTSDLADQVISNVRQHLMGPYGIRRYLGDSYWCANYKQLLAADQRTADFSDNLEERDRLMKPGGEAQWCLFDPILAIIYFKRLQSSQANTDRQMAIAHLDRSLRQLSNSDSPAGPYRCPESFYEEGGVYRQNDITPLLWTQANLKLALSTAVRALG